MNKLKVVFIDDEPMICKLFPQFVKNTYSDVQAFSSPQLALEECLKNPPDLIFTDFSMPGLTGQELALKLPANIPIYLMSGHLIQGDQEVLTYQFKDILPKPFNFNLIRSIILNRYEELNASKNNS